MEIHNLQEYHVMTTLEQQLEHRIDICKCEQCFADMAVYALNRLPPRYVSKQRGETFSRMALSDAQGRATVLAAVVSAIKVVANSPTHDRK